MSPGLAGVARAERPLSTTVTVLVMTPGAHPFERFGHAAVRVDEPGHRGDDARVYNYGSFDGSDPHLVRRFLSHTMPFWLAETDWRSTEEQYRRRQIRALELDLDEDEARALADRLARNALPQNRNYVYEFFRDNCSTRVRDMVATAVPTLTALQQRPAQRSLRAQVVEQTRPAPLFGRAIDLALNGLVDGPTSRWDDAFLPRELAAVLLESHRPLNEGGRPLVRRETTWTGPDFVDLTQPRTALLDALWLLLLLPLGLGALGGGRLRGARVLAGAGLALWGLVTGLVGVALVILSLTPHDVARMNGNVVALWPATLVLVPYGVRLARGRVALVGVQRVRALLVALAAPIVIDLLGHAIGRAHQQHVTLLLFVLAGHALAYLALRCSNDGADEALPIPVDATLH